MKTKILFSVFLIIISTAVFCQKNRVIDSLEIKLKTLSHDTIKVDCLNTLSSEYLGLKKNEVSLQYGESALELAKKCNFKKGMATAYQNVGFANEKMADYPEAVKNLTESIKIY